LDQAVFSPAAVAFFFWEHERVGRERIGRGG